MDEMNADKWKVFFFFFFAGSHAAPPQMLPWVAAHIVHMKNCPWQPVCNNTLIAR